MKCSVSCKCGELKGTADLITPKDRKPRLAFTLESCFIIKKDEAGCPTCLTAVMAVGDWA